MRLGQLLGLVGGHVRVLSDDEEAGDILDEAQRTFEGADVRGINGELEKDVVPLALLLDGVGELAAAPGVGGVDLAAVRADALGYGVNVGGGEFGTCSTP